MVHLTVADGEQLPFAPTFVGVDQPPAEQEVTTLLLPSVEAEPFELPVAGI